VSEQSQEHGVALDHPVKRRTAAERFAGFSDRIARSLPSQVRTDIDEPMVEPDYPEDEQATSWYEVVPRFPLARSGYECAAVDEHIEMLERELEEMESELEQLRARTPAHNEVEEPTTRSRTRSGASVSRPRRSCWPPTTGPRRPRGRPRSRPTNA
jgi:hypothetical protein